MLLRKVAKNNMQLNIDAKNSVCAKLKKWGITAKIDVPKWFISAHIGDRRTAQIKVRATEGRNDKYSWRQSTSKNLKQDESSFHVLVNAPKNEQPVFYIVPNKDVIKYLSPNKSKIILGESDCESYKNKWEKIKDYLNPV
jgi:putative transposon-encoded protein